MALCPCVRSSFYAAIYHLSDIFTIYIICALLYFAPFEDATAQVALFISALIFHNIFPLALHSGSRMAM